jgi:hypothetical protein
MSKTMYMKMKKIVFAGVFGVVCGVVPAFADGAALYGTQGDTSFGSSESGQVSTYAGSESSSSARSGKKSVELQDASSERRSAAVGHYSRARTMLIEAIEEFEHARTIARPDLVLNGDDFRAGLIQKIDDLSKVIEPQANVARAGARFDDRTVGVRLPDAKRYYVPASKTTTTKRAVLKKSKLKKPVQYTRARMGEKVEAASSETTSEVTETKKTTEEGMIEDKPGKRAFGDEIPTTEVKSEASDKSSAIEDSESGTTDQVVVESTKVEEKVEIKDAVEKNSAGKDLATEEIKKTETTTQVSTDDAGKRFDDAALSERLQKLANEISDKETTGKETTGKK